MIKLRHIAARSSRASACLCRQQLQQQMPTLSPPMPLLLKLHLHEDLQRHQQRQQQRHLQHQRHTGGLRSFSTLPISEDVDSSSLPSSSSVPSSTSSKSSSSSSKSSSSSSTTTCCYLTPETVQVIREYARKPQTSLSLQMLMRSGQVEFLERGYKSPEFSGRLGKQLAMQRILLQVASFLRQEIPVRLARRIEDLDRVPLMRDMRSVQAVKRIYVDSFLEMIQFPPIHTAMDEERFASMLETLYVKHSGVLVQMAKGAYELREAVRAGRVDGAAAVATVVSGLETDSEDSDDDDRKEHQQAVDFARMQECHAFLDRFYLSRIGIRVLVGQYLALRAQQLEKQQNDLNSPSTDAAGDEEVDDYIGMICLNTSPYEVVRQAAEDAKRMCRREYGKSPQVHIAGQTDLTFPYIPTYLHYICLELLKNALRATCERHARALPAVTVILADGHDNEDVVIKIADEGGGIPRSQVDKIWSYLYTTANPKIQAAFIAADSSKEDHSTANNSPIAGLGYGLPISRSYCEYFGGALDLVSMEGYGTDAFIHLKRLGDSEEPLPV